MLDLWGFLLQTLTVSGVAMLLLVIKALFKDKLSPKWHFAVWSVLGVVILIPAGFNGRYTLFHWQLVVEVIKSWVGDYSFIQVLFPIPILTAIPKTIIQWIFAGYILGVIINIIKYTVFYIRLRLVLRNGITPNDELIARIQKIAVAQKVKVGRVIVVPGLPGAFVCGIIRPVLVIPADNDIDDKVILHELLHMKYRDTLWSTVICFLKCLHWCNPLIIYCANHAINDMEARCDQHVLEQLEGEERRDYGRILLSMLNDRFVKTPGSTCINNGQKNIRDRIEAIARFKKYPAGMELVSVCIIIILTIWLGIGAQAGDVYISGSSVQIAMASARSTPCTTYAGAFDTYAKAILTGNGVYRAMCAPSSMQADIINEMYAKDKEGIRQNWNGSLDVLPEIKIDGGYYIYNLKHIGRDAYEGLLVFKLNYPPDGRAEEEGKIYLAVQNLRVGKESGRWNAVPLEDFRSIMITDQHLERGCPDLPGFTYSGTASDMQIDVTMQTIHYVDSPVVKNDESLFMFGIGTYFDTTPKPNAVFTSAQRVQFSNFTHIGTESERNGIRQIGLSVAPVYSGQARPEYLHAAVLSSGSGSSGEYWSYCKLDSGWEPSFYQVGDCCSIDPVCDNELPKYYAADLYINHKLVAQIDLHMQEGVKE